MKNISQYATYILDCLKPMGCVTIRSMFGGYGIYHQKTIFAIIADDILYFKVTAHNQKDYEAAHSQPFTYQKQGRNIQMSYWRVPDIVLEDEDLLLHWAMSAYHASLIKDA